VIVANPLDTHAYQVRPAGLADVDFLTAVVLATMRAQGRQLEGDDELEWRQGFARWTAELISDDDPHNATSVIEVDGQPVGRLRIIRSHDSVELAGIQLLSQAQGRGIGTAIINDLKAEAAAAGVPLDIGVEKDNPDARRLYERLGCTKVGETDREYKLRWRS
jgi:ribosomal protein S18 acetylase RimI-like enzyme